MCKAQWKLSSSLGDFTQKHLRKQQTSGFLQSPYVSISYLKQNPVLWKALCACSCSTSESKWIRIGWLTWNTDYHSFLQDYQDVLPPPSPKHLCVYHQHTHKLLHYWKQFLWYKNTTHQSSQAYEELPALSLTWSAMVREHQTALATLIKQTTLKLLFPKISFPLLCWERCQAQHKTEDSCCTLPTPGTSTPLMGLGISRLRTMPYLPHSSFTSSNMSGKQSNMGIKKWLAWSLTDRKQWVFFLWPVFAFDGTEHTQWAATS